MNAVASILFSDRRADCVFVVPCSLTKSPNLKVRPMVAREAYQGQAFVMTRRWLESVRAKWCILSGGYGFIWPDTIIEDYDCKIAPVTEAMVWDEAFDTLKQKQYGRLAAARRVVVLGSRLYASNAAWLLGRNVEAPFAGMPIGKMLQAIGRLGGERQLF